MVNDNPIGLEAINRIKEELALLEVQQAQKMASLTQAQLLNAQDQAMNELQKLVSEANEFSIADPFDRFLDPSTGQYWPLANNASNGSDSLGKVSHFNPGKININSEEELRHVVSMCRELALHNEFGINVLENLVNFVVGSGQTYKAKLASGILKRGQDPTPAMEQALFTAQTAIDEFIADHEFDLIEQERVIRLNRDGEYFDHFIPRDDGTLEVFVIEPDQVCTPQGKIKDPTVKWGVQYDRQCRRVLGYYVKFPGNKNPEFVDASEIQHRKINVDRNVPRGIPTLFPIHKNLVRACKLLRNMSVVATVQAALVGTRTFENASESQVRNFLTNKSKFAIDSPLNQQSLGNANLRVNYPTRYIDKWVPGTLMTMPHGQKIDFFAKAINAGSFVQVLQADLRAAAARVQLPEYILTSDASNNNFASIRETGTPFNRSIKRRQAIAKKDGAATMGRVLDEQERYGILGPLERQIVSVDIQSPMLESVDKEKDSKAKEVEYRNGVLSPQTWAAETGRDYKTEQENIKQHEQDYGSVENDPNPLI
jgi:capsid protein